MCSPDTPSCYPQVNAGNPTPAPTPAATPAATPTPSSAPTPNKVNGLLGGIDTLHKDVFGFQALDPSTDTSGVVLPVSASVGVQGQDINSAGAGDLPLLCLSRLLRLCTPRRASRLETSKDTRQQHRCQQDQQQCSVCQGVRHRYCLCRPD